MMKHYDVAVIGAGPAGCMAAIRAGQLKKTVALFERNDSIGRKLMLTGNGRCNLTNDAPLEVFLKKYKPNGEFFRTAFQGFFNKELKGFFQDKGLEFKTENNNRVLPATDKASSVLKVLNEYLKENGVDVVYHARVLGVKKNNAGFTVVLENGQDPGAEKIIISTGGVSYKATGSSGDGLAIARSFGHTVTPLIPGLVPLKVKEGFVKELQGIALKNVRLAYQQGKKKIVSEPGELLFTHYGLSGPLVLDVSSDVLCLLDELNDVELSVDFTPESGKEQLEAGLAEQLALKGNARVSSLIQEFLPKRLAVVFLRVLGVDPLKRCSQVSKKERLAIAAALKDFPLTIIGSLGFNEAMVTCGGVAMKEIDPRSMESKLAKGLYFCGEVVEGSAASGGYNLQQAFSTGRLAGESAAKK